jgi:hypothetical protein
MANHVTSVLEIEFTSAEDAIRFSEWTAHYPIDESITYGERIELCCETMLQNLYPDKEDTRDYYIENLGAKWIYFDDTERWETTMFISWTTAWDFPEKLFNKLTEYLQSEYKGFICKCTFEDEGFGFVGAAVSNDTWSDIEYYEPIDELVEYRDEEDYLSDDFYEVIWQRKDEMLQECLANIQE